MDLIVATSNKHKIVELRMLIPKSIILKSLSEIGFNEPISETGTTFNENALQKAQHIYSLFKMPVIADDSGLEVYALNGEPGVYSARYSGENATDIQNVNKLLKNMEGVLNRKARFVASIALIVNGMEHVFTGICEGAISEIPHGKTGFGYDPVFIPDGYDQTFAELSSEIKNAVSHRARAIQQLNDFLNLIN